MREVAASSNKPKIDYSACPLWHRLDRGSQYALQLAYRRASDYKRRLIPPDRYPDLMEFDAAREMRQLPGQGERHMRADA